MRTTLVALVMVAALWPFAGLAQAGGTSARVAVQPFDGDIGPVLRDDVVRALRSRGFRIVTSIPRADGTGPYLSLAHDHQLTAFVTGDVETHRSWQSITFLVWNGATGSVVGRWSATAPPKRLRRAVARGFWKHLSKALASTQPPPRPDLEAAPPMYIDASYGNDAPLVRR